MPPAVIARKGVNLIDYDNPQIPEEGFLVGPSRHQHHFKILWRSQQTIGRLPQDRPLLGIPDVSVPNPGPTPDQVAVSAQPDIEVVQERLDRAEIEDAESGPVLRQHPGKDREECRLRFAPGGGRKQNSVPAPEDLADAFLLKGAQFTPTEGVDDVVLKGWVQLIERRHSFNSMSSTLAAVVTFLSISVSSAWLI